MLSNVGVKNVCISFPSLRVGERTKHACKGRIKRIKKTAWLERDPTCLFYFPAPQGTSPHLLSFLCFVQDAGVIFHSDSASIGDDWISRMACVGMKVTYFQGSLLPGLQNIRGMPHCLFFNQERRKIGVTVQQLDLFRVSIHTNPLAGLVLSLPTQSHH